MVKDGQLAQCNVTQIEVIADIGEPNTDKKARKRFRVTHPNTCTLKYDKAGVLLREMLEKSSIEPKQKIDVSQHQSPLELAEDKPESK